MAYDTSLETYKLSTWLTKSEDTEMEDISSFILLEVISPVNGGSGDPILSFIICFTIDPVRYRRPGSFCLESFMKSTKDLKTNLGVGSFRISETDIIPTSLIL